MINLWIRTAVLWLASASAMAQMETPAPIVLEGQSEKVWEIETQRINQAGRIVYTYRQHGVLLASGTLETGGQAEFAPDALLFEGLPAMVFTSFDGSDEDVYFVTWQSGTSSWSALQRVHPDNSLPDMAPEITAVGQGLEVSWRQNTGPSIVTRRARLLAIGGGFQLVPAPDSQPLTAQITQASSSPYDALEPRWVSDPLICIAHGDSITAGCKRNSAGQGDSRCYNRVYGKTYYGYTDDLITRLKTVHSSSVAYNYGAPGYRSYQGVDIQSSIMSAKSQANCMLIMFGANDLYQGLHPASTAANVDTMAQKAINAGMVPIVATVTPNTTGYGSIGSYNNYINSMIGQKGYTKADQYSKMVANGWPHSGDGLHVSNHGDYLMAQEFYRAMTTNKWLFPPADWDGDGVPSVTEGRNTDTDGDGIKDYADTDDNNDGTLTKDQLGEDRDNDGIPDYRDMDIRITVAPMLQLLLLDD